MTLTLSPREILELRDLITSILRGKNRDLVDLLCSKLREDEKHRVKILK